MQSIIGSGIDLRNTSERAHTDLSEALATVTLYDRSDEVKQDEPEDFDEIFAYG